MYVKIEVLEEDEEGKHFQGLIPKPQRGEVPTLGVLETKDEARRQAQLHRWYQELKTVNRDYSAALATYTRSHLGDANLVQEEVE